MSDIALLITETQMDELARFTKEDFPHESCSLLLGNIVDNKYHVKVLKRMENVEHSEISFNIDPDELIKVYQWASDNGLNVIGIFHSHLDGTNPSSTDLTFMRINPVIWLIYEVSTSTYKAFLLIQDSPQEIRVEISKD
ncbi:MAG TPA: M67 family metallopeptidase [Nitrososphaeraceae archaeon]|nr:M67 family metallopeptidase [Nitrososphaeraceae archaeon]